MKLLRYGPEGQEKPGILDDDHRIRDLSAVLPDGDITTLENIEKVRLQDITKLPVVWGNSRIGACIPKNSPVYCVGLNYKDHIEECKAETPTEPVIFPKAPTSVCGPNDEVIIPKGSKKTDWEVELGVVIGKRIDHEITPEEALKYIAGYTVVNDISERKWQLGKQKGQWLLGKSAPTFAPIGPYLVTPDEIPDPQKLHLFCEVNGKTMQDSSTKDMVFSVAQVISYMSTYMVMDPGTIISTGTPQGVALSGDTELNGKKPEELTEVQRQRKYLEPGHTMRLGIDGIGVQHQRCVAHDRSRAAELGGGESAVAVGRR